MKGEADPVFTFSCEFLRPTDNMHNVPAQACQRFLEDSRRFPPGAYVESSLLWKGEQWRTPSPSERAQMLGAPPSATAAVTGSQDDRVRLRNSLLGNGFHVPSIMVLISLLAGLCDTKVQFMPDPTLSSIRARTEHTLCGGDWLYRAPGLLSANAIVADMQNQFSAIVIAPEVWRQCRNGLSHCDLALPQAFSCFQRSLETARGSSHRTPANVTRPRSPVVRIFCSGQGWGGWVIFRHPGLCRVRSCLPGGLMMMLILWLTPSRSGKIFFLILRSANDMLFDPSRRQYAPFSVLLSVPLTESGADKDPAFLACMTNLLRWPDRSQAMDFVAGFPIVGEIERSGVFREVRPRDAEHPDEWLGPQAALAVDAILSSPPPRFASDIL